MSKTSFPTVTAGKLLKRIAGKDRSLTKSSPIIRISEGKYCTDEKFYSVISFITAEFFSTSLKIITPTTETHTNSPKATSTALSQNGVSKQ